tara:strand:- start:2727 stop:3035 length:309 start_codon:yes stop_codon:yes gene_type:complete
MLKIFSATILANLITIIFLAVSLAGGFEEDPGPEELPIEPAESVLDELAVEPEPLEEPELTEEPTIASDTGIVDASGNIVIWSQGNVTYAGDISDIYVRYGL